MVRAYRDITGALSSDQACIVKSASAPWRGFLVDLVGCSGIIVPDRLPDAVFTYGGKFSDHPALPWGL
jgi:hypothetical protein